MFNRVKQKHHKQLLHTLFHLHEHGKVDPFDNDRQAVWNCNCRNIDVEMIVRQFEIVDF